MASLLSQAQLSELKQVTHPSLSLSSVGHHRDCGYDAVSQTVPPFSLSAEEEESRAGRTRGKVGRSLLRKVGLIWLVLLLVREGRCTRKKGWSEEEVKGAEREEAKPGVHGECS